jgi:hypothetical protein
MSVKQLRSAIKQYKKEKCKPFSKLRKQQLMELIDELGLHKPAEAQAIAKGLGFVGGPFYGDPNGNPNLDLKLLKPTYKRLVKNDWRPQSAYKDYAKGSSMYPKMSTRLQNLIHESFASGGLRERDEYIPQIEQMMAQQLINRPGYIENVLAPQPLPVTLRHMREGSGVYYTGEMGY